MMILKSLIFKSAKRSKRMIRLKGNRKYTPKATSKPYITVPLQIRILLSNRQMPLLPKDFIARALRVELTSKFCLLVNSTLSM
jgi:hypothetical protein